METYLWKINKKKLDKTNLIRYSNFIKKNYKIDSGSDFNKMNKTYKSDKLSINAKLLHRHHLI